MHCFVFRGFPQAEESVKSAGFSRTAIFRPGLLDRGDKARALEKVGSWLVSYRAY